MSKSWSALALIGAWSVAGVAQAQPAGIDDKDPFAWEVVAGSIASTPDGQRWIGTSDGGAGEFSRGHYRFPHAVAPEVEISVRMRRISGDVHQPYEVYFPGGSFLVVPDGRWAFWGETDARWTGWQSSPAIRSDENLLAVRQMGRHVQGFVNGVEVGSFDLELDPVPARPSVFFKGDPGSRSRIELWDFSIRELAPARTGRRMRAPVIFSVPSPREAQRDAQAAPPRR